MELNLQEQKQKFLDIAKNNIKREGIAELLEYLQKTDFFEAPASTKFHSSFAGGLCLHSLNVYERYVKNLEKEYGEKWQDFVSLETATIIALFHDICKANVYKVEYRNVKEDGVWVQKPLMIYTDFSP